MPVSSSLWSTLQQPVSFRNPVNHLSRFESRLRVRLRPNRGFLSFPLQSCSSSLSFSGSTLIVAGGKESGKTRTITSTIGGGAFPWAKVILARRPVRLALIRSEQ